MRGNVAWGRDEETGETLVDLGGLDGGEAEADLGDGLDEGFEKGA